MYLEIDEHFPMHGKSIRLCSRLCDPVAWAYIQKLWSWACGNAQDGNISDLEPQEIEFLVGWAGDKGAFYATAVWAGFIDESQDANGKTIRKIHNWMKRTGGAIRRMQDRSAAMRAFRDQKKLKSYQQRDVTVTARCTHSDATVTSRSPPRLDKTRLDKTRQEETNTHTPEPAAGPPVSVSVEPDRRAVKRKRDYPWPEDLRAWYAAYPRKVSPEDAAKAWRETDGRRPPLPEMLATLAWQRREWAALEPRFIKHPGPYLRAGKWADERPSKYGAADSSDGSDERSRRALAAKFAQETAAKVAEALGR